MEQRQKKTTSWLIILAVLVFTCLCLGCLAASLAVAGLLDRGVDVFPELQASWQWQSGVRHDAVEGTLRLAGGNPITLDPALVEDSTSAEYVVKIFSGLVGNPSKATRDISSRET